METNCCSLIMESSHPDLVINVGEVTLGEENRKTLQKTQGKKIQKEREKIAQAACALLNSGGGVIQMQMANKEDRLLEMGLDLEEALRDLIKSLDLEAFFETKQQGRCFSIFVKSWNSDLSLEDGPTKPRICSLYTSLYQKSGTSVFQIKSTEAFHFLKVKKRGASDLIDEGFPHSKIHKVVPQNIRHPDLAEQVFQSDELEYETILPFPESQNIEFKEFSTKNIEKYIKSTIPKYVSAFANSKGGYLFIGVHDTSKKVLGCRIENVDRDSLKRVMKETISKLPVVHFCSSAAPQMYAESKVIDVLNMNELYSYLCVIKVKPFCCAVFSEAPSSWMIKDGQVCSLTPEEWIDRMMDTDHELAEDFESQLSLSERPPLCRPVYSKKGLEHKTTLQQRLFPVPSEHFLYTPEPLWKELSSQHEGLEELLKEELRPFSRGLLILSRSWAVDLNLQEKQEVICDALLVAQNSPPTLYTVLGGQDAEAHRYSTLTAFTLKQKLVNMGGYTGKLCVRTKILYLNPESTVESLQGPGSQIDYPESYHLANAQQMEALLQSLVIILLGFRSFLSDQLGCEVLNLLTAQQYEILSKNLSKCRELFIHGLPGSGKTIMAMKIMEKIRNVFHCEAHEILYVCENQPLRNFIGNKNICHAVTRKTFMKGNFEKIRHIIIDEAQNFRTEDGCWYDKAKSITWREKDGPGILWIFLDYFQTSHLDITGLPVFSAQYPKEELTKVVRNADPIANYLQKEMQAVRASPLPNIPPQYLEMLCTAQWAQGVSGYFELKHFPTLKRIAIEVANKCQFLFKKAYSPKDIAILFGRVSEVSCKDIVLNEIERTINTNNGVSHINNVSILSSDITFDSIRRFSGLERNIVFGINPKGAESELSHSLLLCLASRAKKHLYIYFGDFIMEYPNLRRNYKERYTLLLKPEKE